MNTNIPLMTLLATSAMLLASGSAAAGALDVGGLATVDAQANAQAHTDAALGLVQDAKATAESAANDAKTHASADASLSTSVLESVKAGVASNAAAMKGWIMGIFGHAAGATRADIKGDAQQTLDGAQSGRIDAQGALAGETHVDAKQLAPPQPDTSFLGSIRAGLEGMLHFG